MTRIAKLLVVFVTVASLSFAAFAGALRFGGPNWNELANHDGLKKAVAITRSDTGQYAAVMRVSGDPVASSMNVAEVVTKSQAKVLSDLRNELQDISNQINTLTPQQSSLKELIAADRTGLEKHAAAWSAQLQNLAERIATLSDELAAKGSEVKLLQDELIELRYEVLRLRNQLELLRDDLFAAEQQEKALQNELRRLQEDRLRLERRQEQLHQQLGSY
ncbi:hypothetical protein GC163_13445 [bacterium]|nr:hypothetical protein [bacterium]